MSKDTETKTETQLLHEEENDDDFFDYNNNDNNIIDKALGNIKNDPASARSRPRRKPINQLTLEDEVSIPKMPDKIIKKPNKEEFNKKIEELREQSKKKGASIKEYYAKINEERTGVKKDDKNNIYKERKELLEKKDELLKFIQNEDKDVGPLRNTLRELTDEVRKYERYHFSNKPEVILAQIRDIKEKLSFSELTSTEEKQLIDKKPLLEEYYKQLKKLHDFKDKYKDSFNKTSKQRKELKEINEKIAKINEKYKKTAPVEKKKDEDNPVINQYYKTIESLKEDKKNIQEQIDKANKDYDNQYYEYKEQSKLINYIKKCQEKIDYLKKRKRMKEKREKKMEKENKKKTKDESDNLKDIQIAEKQIIKPKKYDNQIKECNELNDYFSALLPKKEEEEEKEENVQREKSKLDEDLEKGLLKQITQKNYDEFLGVSDGGIKKKR